MDLVAFIKNQKNPVEQENIRKSNIKEGVAVCRYIRHIYDRMEKGPVTEMYLVRDLEIFRKMDPEYVQPANLGIIAYGENAALPHYRTSAPSRAGVWRRLPQHCVPRVSMQP